MWESWLTGEAAWSFDGAGAGGSVGRERGLIKKDGFTATLLPRRSCEPTRSFSGVLRSGDGTICAEGRSSGIGRVWRVGRDRFGGRSAGRKATD